MVRIESHKIKINTKGNGQTIDITDKIFGKLLDSNMKEGVVTVFVPGSTASLSTLEFEPGLIKDIPEIFDTLIPQDKDYAHNLTWQDGNGHSHLRATLIGPSLSVPFSGQKLQLGTWQQVVLIDFDTRSRTREILLKFIGE